VVGIRYDDIAKIPAIITEVEAMLKAHKEIDQSQALRVYFNYFNTSSHFLAVVLVHLTSKSANI
jgi:MscS family membrane protein